MNRFKGTGVALVTPFLKNGEIDFPALKKLIDFDIAHGVDYLVTLGTTGESVTLSQEEKKKVLEFTIEAVAGRVPLVAGFGGNNTKEVLDSIGQFHFKGIDAILSVSPYYNKPTQEGIYQHYKAVAAASPVPVILYNVPGRTASNVTAATTLRLSNLKNIIGIKEASGDFQQCMTIIKNKPHDFLVISGDDIITLPLMAIGADGVISVVANAFPEDFSQLVRSAASGNFSKAAELHYKLMEIIINLFVEGNPAGVKCALNLIGVCGQTVRLPLVEASSELHSKMQGLILTLDTVHSK